MTQNLYNMAGQLIATTNIDSGLRQMLYNAAQLPIYIYDNRKQRIRNTYDALLRPLQVFLKENAGTEITVQKIEYGNSAAKRNINQIENIYAQDGKTVYDLYDFKGNVLTLKKQFAQVYNTALNYEGTVNLQANIYTVQTTYNALNVPINITQPDNTIVENIYDKGGLLKTVKHNNQGYITDILYNARGQREHINYGNNSTTSYYYDTKNFRLLRLLTTKQSGVQDLQDLNYTYDAVGNIIEVTDNAQQVNYFNNTTINPTSTYEYDALYRLLRATGREKKNLSAPGWEDFQNNLPVPNLDPNALQNYTHNYSYDKLGNILQQQAVGNWTRNYVYDTLTNRLLKHDEQQVADDYTYDTHGNITRMPHLSSMVWDYLDQLREAQQGTSTSFYNYDIEGNRTRKVVEKQGGIKEERYYVGNYEIYKITGSLDNHERSTVKINDDTKTFVLVETRTSENPLVRYQYDNHLGSACLELDENANIISYEEYHPFGTTSYRAGRSETEVSLKRYKYCGKERDEETGLYYYGARYYASWLCRFASVDPLQHEYPHYTPYQYAGNMPITYIDLDGLEPTIPPHQWSSSKGYKSYGDYYKTGGTEGVMKVQETFVKWQFDPKDQDGKVIHKYWNTDNEKWEQFKPVAPTSLSKELEDIGKLAIQEAVEISVPVFKIIIGVIAVAAAIPSGGTSLGILGAFGAGFSVTSGTMTTVLGITELTLNLTDNKELVEKLPSGYLDATIGLSLTTIIDDEEVNETISILLTIVEGTITLNYKNPTDLEKVSNAISGTDIAIKITDITISNITKEKPQEDERRQDIER